MTVEDRQPICPRNEPRRRRPRKKEGCHREPVVAGRMSLSAGRCRAARVCFRYGDQVAGANRQPVQLTRQEMRNIADIRARSLSLVCKRWFAEMRMSSLDRFQPHSDTETQVDTPRCRPNVARDRNQLAAKAIRAGGDFHVRLG